MTHGNGVSADSSDGEPARSVAKTRGVLRDPTTSMNDPLKPVGGSVQALQEAVGEWSNPYR